MFFIFHNVHAWQRQSELRAILAKNPIAVLALEQEIFTKISPHFILYLMNKINAR